MSLHRVQFGPATIAVTADDAATSVLAALSRWLPSDPITDDPDVVFHLHARPQSASSPAAAGWWDGKAWSASLQRSGSRLDWTLRPRESAVFRATRVVPDAVIRAAHVHHFGRAEMRAGALLYGHVLPGAQLALLARGATLVHASSLVGPRGGGVLVLGRGGAGKTSASTSLYMRQPDRWRSMSDDLAIVSRDGLLHRSPVPINVFPYNTERFDELAAVVAKDASLADRAHWWFRARILGPSGVARRFAPLRGFMGPTAVPLAAVVELVRDDVASPLIRTLDARAVIDEACRVLDDELARGLRPMRRLYAEGLPALPFMHPDEQRASVASILADAMVGRQITHITLPRRTPPDAVGQLVEAAVGDTA